ncbi:hypothetical protein Kpol_1036p40 [Vanderwaltozyma polyspora DSM 70294]|uniref:Alkyl transferase n=1 Tax=Vanderwaltozyma polyspora (strain ATCC 22028 / DSM 70294 / BCRC 21397 / CBS 2163 / NBRC 10782 / NRRL Y-8283 / UCD 57-17) TaxID=436907 RepID=A7TEJ0_VANPO|nr:uncharacterized protein Kpol_1036p40 [Vanderwaltozyma polyspora DSM 70294]EDO19297.1 hypothetical protein Kpol_1036p40 [Vanderwaltozyma polyspora DSM 70294]
MNNYNSSSDTSMPMIFLKNLFSKTIRTSNCVPKHVGFVMDGNRRYAKKKDIEIKEGHEAGFLSMSKILELCYESGVEITTVFAFSIENFKRSSKEVDHLMKLASDRIRQITEHGDLAEKYGIRVRVIGDLSLLPTDVLKDIELATEITKNNNRATLNICFPYTGREEIFHSVKTVLSQNLSGNEINEKLLDSNLYTSGLPPLDLLVRTSGVTRLSDFMLWQVINHDVTIELLDCLWPEFGPIRMGWILLKFVFNKSFTNVGSKTGEEYDGELNETNGVKDDNNQVLNKKKN